MIALLKTRGFFFLISSISSLMTASVLADDDDVSIARAKSAIVFLIAGQSNAGGVAAFSPETNAQAGMHKKHPTIATSKASSTRR